jgi:hypothetical protein
MGYFMQVTFQRVSGGAGLAVREYAK